MTKAQNIQDEIGWIGVGKMGNPMATRLMEAGHRLTICDPVVENRASLVARGARVAATPGEVAARCTLIFATIPDDGALENVIYGNEEHGSFLSCVGAGVVLVEMSTVSPSLSRRVGEDLARRGVGYLRCPISGSTALARAGSLTALASGDATAWERAVPFLDVLAARKFYLGPGEEARYMKLVLNALVGATSVILAEALALGAIGGLSDAQMMEVIAESAIASPLIRYKQDMIAHRDFRPAFSVEQMMKDFTIITDAGRVHRVPLFATNLILQQYTAAASGGYAEKDFFAMVEWMRSAFNLDNYV
ncbi:MAG: NAD(P)-dependent oxidoreductase [Acidobacteriia bacterium]|nr:NAD(P)-dependent oxidoreductase [Methyloceanibacter sp.]MCL6490395.1 NAD(P)-dependent oxidoreductase [Terriglobia bacterium]